MGRNFKFEIGEVVRYNDTDHAVIVDYRQDTRGRGEYRMVRTTAPHGKQFGAATWRKSYLLWKSEVTHIRGGIVRTYKANLRLGGLEDSGCLSQCCAHVAIPISQIKTDGTLGSDDV